MQAKHSSNISNAWWKQTEENPSRQANYSGAHAALEKAFFVEIVDLA